MRKMRATTKPRFAAAILFIASLSLGGCRLDDRIEDPVVTEQEATADTGGLADQQNAAPVISGTPPAEATAGAAYSFSPQAGDSDGDPISFDIVNLPAWARFDPATGRLSGTPTDGDIGIYTDIRLSVTDGKASASLDAFSISVEAISMGSVTLSWNPPTENTDGTPITDLAGYRIYWTTTPGTYSSNVTIENPGITTYVVDNLAPGTYEFVATSFNSARIESDYSAPATKFVQ